MFLLSLVCAVVTGTWLITCVCRPWLHRPRPAFLDRSRQTLTVTGRQVVSPDTVRLSFRLPQGYRLGLPVGQHIQLLAPSVADRAAVPGEWNGRADEDMGPLMRKYTPITADRSNSMELLVKIYRPCDKFVDGGRMSLHLDALRGGDEVVLSGPWGTHEYVGPGHLRSMGRHLKGLKHLAMMAGGSGITPMLQIIRCVLANKQSDRTTLALLYANQKQEDILLRAELELLQHENRQQFHVWYTLDHPPEGWTYSSGFIDRDMIQQHLPPPAADTAVLMCGPPPMIEHACRKNLQALGYPDSLQFVW